MTDTDKAIQDAERHNDQFVSACNKLVDDLYQAISDGATMIYAAIAKARKAQG